MNGNGGENEKRMVQPVTSFNVVALLVAALEKGPRDSSRGATLPRMITAAATKRPRSATDNNQPPSVHHPVNDRDASTLAAPRETGTADATSRSSSPLPRRRRRQGDTHPAPAFSSSSPGCLPRFSLPHAPSPLPRPPPSSFFYGSQTPPSSPFPVPLHTPSQRCSSSWPSPPSTPQPPPSPPPSPSSSCLRLPDAVVEVILDHLPLPRALSMVVRSRAADRSVSCSRYALSRMDKMVAGLAAAEEAFHLAGKSKAAKRNSATKDGIEDGKGQPKKQANGADVNHAHDDTPDDDAHKSDPDACGAESTPFFQLGDLSHLDLVYKLALDLARKKDPLTRTSAGGGDRPDGSVRSALTSSSKQGADGASEWRSGGGSGGGGDAGARSSIGACGTSSDSGDLAWSGAGIGRDGEGPEWSVPGPSAARAWRVGRRLMDLLATGMVANLRMRMMEDPAGRTPEVGIVTDCMHPTASGNRHFRFRDSVDVCGLLGFDRFPLVVISGICVLNTESPIFACLPGVETVPVRFTATDPARSGAGDGVGGRERKRYGAVFHRSGVGGSRGAGDGGAAGGRPEGGESPSEGLGAARAARAETCEGPLFWSRGSTGLASVAQTYRSPCGRYTAALVRFRQPPGSLEGRHPERSPPGQMWAAETRDEVARLSCGVGPCASPFCRSWDVPSYTLVIFRHQAKDSNEPRLLLQAPGRLVRSSGHGGWTFADFFHGLRLHREWCRLLGM